MNANAAATTAMTTNEPLDFVLPEMGDADFSSEELAEDTDGLTMSFPRIKIPAGGVLQFEIPNGDPQHPDYRPTLTGVILYNHASCAYWPEGDEYSDDVPPLCSSVDGKQGYGEPGGTCAACALSQFGSASNGRGKACKNMRVLYLLRSGEFMPLAINLSPTSISPFREFLNQGGCFPQPRHLWQPCGDWLETPDKPGGQGLQRCHVQAFGRFPRRPACRCAQVRFELP